MELDANKRQALQELNLLPRIAIAKTAFSYRWVPRSKDCRADPNIQWEKTTF
jgi:hypothetical protein